MEDEQVQPSSVTADSIASNVAASSTGTALRRSILKTTIDDGNSCSSSSGPDDDCGDDGKNKSNSSLSPAARRDLETCQASETSLPSRTASRRRRHSISALDDIADNAEQQQEPHRPHRRVSFTVVEISEHSPALGDHPDVSSGPPLSISWKFERRTSLDFESYEEFREPRRRSRSEIVIPNFERRQMLRHEGYSNREIDIAAREAQEIKMKRRDTLEKMDSAMERVQDRMKSVKKVIKSAERVLSFGGRVKSRKKVVHASSFRNTYITSSSTQNR